jgi:hypothetical protein
MIMMKRKRSKRVASMAIGNKEKNERKDEKSNQCESYFASRLLSSFFYLVILIMMPFWYITFLFHISKNIHLNVFRYIHTRSIEK